MAHLSYTYRLYCVSSHIEKQFNKELPKARITLTAVSKLRTLWHLQAMAWFSSFNANKSLQLPLLLTYVWYS